MLLLYIALNVSNYNLINCMFISYHILNGFKSFNSSNLVEKSFVLNVHNSQDF